MKQQAFIFCHINGVINSRVYGIFKWFLFVVSFLSCSPHKAAPVAHQSIFIQHIGIQDTPLIPVLILKKGADYKREDFLFYKEYLCGEAEFQKIEKFILDCKSAQSSLNRKSDFGIFEISIEQESFIIDGEYNTMPYFTKLNSLLDSSGSQELSKLITDNILNRLKLGR